MTQKIFSIRDAKSEAYNLPFYQSTMGEAERMFRTTVNDEKTMLNKYPDDFDLYYLGEFDTNKGIFVSLDTPQHMMKSISVYKAPMELNGTSPLK